jgi:UDP-glucose 4-epimerase
VIDPAPEFPRSALVTGASGFIGRALVRRLVDANVDVVCTSRQPRVAAGPERWRIGDPSDAQFVDDLVGAVRPDVIYHLGGAVTGSRALEAVLPTFYGNLLSAIILMRAATEFGCERVVLLGSGDQPTRSEPPCSPYAASKWAMHGYARMFHERYGTPVSTARPFMVYGPEQPDVTKIVPYVTTELLRGRSPQLSSGQRRCDWIYIEDVVDGLLAVTGAPGAVGQLVDLGTGRLNTVRETVEIIATEVGGSASPLWDAIPDRPGETEFVANAVLAEQQCGWTASTSLDAGLAMTVEWYRRHAS